eukprot:TRINITY_DN14956_c0_g1_i1.p1 TRINITY_DN14956_c0_g1~~TRINITY_DN14956_c0_g1_i1.p1  ORF type:complete len:219 (+),score=43.55 TRINITY_DN14956_c0_g1_i1:357-1013(+)
MSRNDTPNDSFNTALTPDRGMVSNNNMETPVSPLNEQETTTTSMFSFHPTSGSKNGSATSSTPVTNSKKQLQFEGQSPGSYVNEDDRINSEYDDQGNTSVDLISSIGADELWHLDSPTDSSPSALSSHSAVHNRSFNSSHLFNTTRSVNGNQVTTVVDVLKRTQQRRQSGILFSWGDDTSALGRSSAHPDEPGQVSGFWTQVASGAYHTVAIGHNGKL